jgi:hypothetical protein
MVKDPKVLVKEIASRVGKHGARKLLVDAGISTSTADKLVGDRYASEVKELTRQAILRAHEACKKAAS